MGIIDKNNNVIKDFLYDKMIVLAAKPKVNVSFNSNGVNIKYENIEFPQSNLILVKKDNKYGVISRNGEIIIPLKNEFDRAKYANLYVLEQNSQNPVSYDEDASSDNKTIAKKNNIKNIGKKIAVVPLIIASGVVVLPCAVTVSPLLLLMFLAFAGGC